jgi:hypothetical protein
MIHEHQLVRHLPAVWVAEHAGACSIAKLAETVRGVKESCLHNGSGARCAQRGLLYKCRSDRQHSSTHTLSNLTVVRSTLRPLYPPRSLSTRRCVLHTVNINAPSVWVNNAVSCRYIYILPHKKFILNF